MLKSIKQSVWSIMLVVLLPAGLAAQNYVYTNNDLRTANFISAYSVGSNGSMSVIAGSPFDTKGAGNGGGLYSANRIIVVGNFLYASNAASNNVSAFTIDSGTGVLTPVINSPFPTNAYDDAYNSGISLAATPDAKFLYAGTTGFGGQITIFSIDSTTGALTMVGTSPVAAGGPVYGLKVSPDGKFLAVALYQTSQVGVFAIQSDGTLQAVANSPFALSSGSPTSVDIDCTDSLLFAGGATGNLFAFNMASDGQLTQVAGSPFPTGLVSNQVVALSADDSVLFSSNQGAGTVTAFAVGTGGSLSASGSSVSAGAGPTGGLAVSRDGTLVYSADANNVNFPNGEVSSFTTSGSSPLTFGTAMSTTLASQLHSVAAYPEKTCSGSTASSGLVASLQLYAGPPPGFDLEGTLGLNPSLAVNPLTQPVDIQVGGLSFSLTAGSFKLFQNGAKSGIYVFQGNTNGANLKVQIAPLGQNQFQISIAGKQIDLSGLVYPITVTVGIGGNSASASVTPILGALRKNSRGQ